MLSVERSPSVGAASPLGSLDYSILQQCMHCGMCLPSCPTFAETGLERNSPRGRISLMRAVADGDLGTTPAFAEEMSYCLGCLACTSACPAGVDYANLLEHARAHVEQSGIVKTRRRDFVRWLTMKQLFMKPRLLRSAGRLLWIYQASGLQTAVRRLRLTRLLPKSLRVAEPSTPTIRRHFSDALIREVETPAASTHPLPRRRVLLLTGCVQDIAFSDINRATADVLLANNCEVVTPRAQSCCGSLHAHNGEIELARTLARRQLDAINPSDFDAIISNAGGCGSHLRHYDRLLADDPRYAARATEWSHKLRDISEWLVEIGFRPPRPPACSGRTTTPTKVTYHDSCHLCHGQKVSAQPRALLKAIPGIELREATEASWCCGSAGIYSLTHPSTANWLRERKLAHLHATEAETVAVANPGCSLHLQAGEAGRDRSLTFEHPVVLLARAYAAEAPVDATEPRD